MADDEPPEESRGLLDDAREASAAYLPSKTFHAYHYLLKYRSSKTFILSTVCLALFTDSFIYGVLVPVLPFLLVRKCHVQDGSEQLWTSAMFALFGLAILVGSPICGWFADRSKSRRLPMLFSLPILLGATGLLGASNKAWMLLLSRFFQGCSTAITWTVGLALTRDTVGKAEVGQWMGTAIASSSVGLVISPMLGGLVYDRAGLWGVLGMMIGLIVLNVFMVLFMVEKRVAYAHYVHVEGIEPYTASQDTYGTIDTEGAPKPTTDNDPEETDSLSEGSTTANNPAAEEFADTEEVVYYKSKKSKLPAILWLLKSPRVMTDAYAVFTQFGLLASFDSFLPLFVKRRFGWDALEAGLIFLAIAIPQLIGPLAGRLSDKFGPRKVAVAGCVLTAPPMFLIRFIGYDDVKHIVLLCALLVLIGCFLTMIVSPVAADLSYAVDQIDNNKPGVFGESGAYAQAYALFNMAMAAATVVGPILAGGIQDRFGTTNLAWVLALWVFSAAIPAFFFMGDDITRPEQGRY